MFLPDVDIKHCNAGSNADTYNVKAWDNVSGELRNPIKSILNLMVAITKNSSIPAQFHTVGRTN